MAVRRVQGLCMHTDKTGMSQETRGLHIFSTAWKISIPWCPSLLFNGQRIFNTLFDIRTCIKKQYKMGSHDLKEETNQAVGLLAFSQLCMLFTFLTEL